MANRISGDNVFIGSVVSVNYVENGKKITEEAILVDNYIIDRMVPREKDGCFWCSIKEEELFIFETPTTKRFVLVKEEFTNYKKERFKLYKNLNYQRLEVGKHVKVIANIYGTPNMKDVEFGTFGIISSIYQNPKSLKMASIIVNSRNFTREIHVPLVNCIVIGK